MTTKPETERPARACQFRLPDLTYRNLRTFAGALDLSLSEAADKAIVAGLDALIEAAIEAAS